MPFPVFTKYELIGPLFGRPMSGSERGGMNLQIELARRRRDSKLVVIKWVAFPEDNTDNAAVRALKEVKVLRQLRGHPNISKILEVGDGVGTGSDLDIGRLAIFLDHCDLGSLEGVRRRVLGERGKKRLHEGFMWHILISITDALYFLHCGKKEYSPMVVSRPGQPQSIQMMEDPNWDYVIHGDLKPGNIFLRNSRNPAQMYPDVVLGDFGAALTRSELVRREPERRIASVLCPGMVPPEHPAVCRRSDVWMLAQTMQELMGITRLTPGGELILEPDLSQADCTSGLKECIRLARNPDANQRPQSAQLAVLVRHYYSVTAQRCGHRLHHELEPWYFDDALASRHGRS